MKKILTQLSKPTDNAEHRQQVEANVISQFRVDRKLIKLVDRDGSKLIHLAAFNGYANVMEVLVNEYKCKIDSKSKSHQTPLVLSIMAGRFNEFSKAIALKANIHQTDVNGNSLFDIALISYIHGEVDTVTRCNSMYNIIFVLLELGVGPRMSKADDIHELSKHFCKEDYISGLRSFFKCSPNLINECNKTDLVKLCLKHCSLACLKYLHDELKFDLLDNCVDIVVKSAPPEYLFQGAKKCCILMKMADEAESIDKKSAITKNLNEHMARYNKVESIKFSQQNDTCASFIKVQFAGHSLYFDINGSWCNEAVIHNKLKKVLDYLTSKEFAVHDQEEVIKVVLQCKPDFFDVLDDLNIKLDYNYLKVSIVQKAEALHIIKVLSLVSEELDLERRKDLRDLTRISGLPLTTQVSIDNFLSGLQQSDKVEYGPSRLTM